MITSGLRSELEQATEGEGQGKNMHWFTQGGRSCLKERKSIDDGVNCGNHLSENSQVCEGVSGSMSSSLPPDADSVVHLPPRPGPGRLNLMRSMRRAVLVEACVSNELQAGEALSKATEAMDVSYCFDVVSSNFIALDRIATAAYDVVFFAAGGDNLLEHEAAAIVKQAIPTIKTVVLDLKWLPPGQGQCVDAFLVHPFSASCLTQLLTDITSITAGGTTSCLITTGAYEGHTGSLEGLSSTPGPHFLLPSSGSLHKGGGATTTNLQGMNCKGVDGNNTSTRGKCFTLQ